MKALTIIHPVSGQPCFTRYPEKLKQRYAQQAQHERALEIKRLREAAGMTFWNGESKDPAAMKRPGEVRS